MKTIYNSMSILAFLFVFASVVNAQKTYPLFKVESSGENIFNYSTIDDYLKQYVEYPEESKRCCIQGTEVVKFIVTAEGKLTDFKVINSVCSKMDTEVIRVLKTTNGKWEPGSLNGKSVDMVQEVSVLFMLRESNDFVKMAKAYLDKGNKLFFIKKKPEKALKYYDCGIILIPNNETLLAARGYCRYELGDNEGAISDWTRLKEIIERNDGYKENFAEDFKGLNGYSAMLDILNK